MLPKPDARACLLRCWFASVKGGQQMFSAPRCMHACMHVRTCRGSLCRIASYINSQDLVETALPAGLEACRVLRPIPRTAAEAAWTVFALLPQRHEAAVQSTLAGFRSKKFRVLVATDVAARGLDIKEVELVVMTDPPKDPETYIHRCVAGAATACLSSAGSGVHPSQAMVGCCEAYQHVACKLRLLIGSPQGPRDLHPQVCGWCRHCLPVVSRLRRASKSGYGRVL